MIPTDHLDELARLEAEVVAVNRAIDAAGRSDGVALERLRVAHDAWGSALKANSEAMIAASRLLAEHGRTLSFAVEHARLGTEGFPDDADALKSAAEALERVL